jgi:hypothetical protein
MCWSSLGTSSRATFFAWENRFIEPRTFWLKRMSWQQGIITLGDWYTLFNGQRQWDPSSTSTQFFWPTICLFWKRKMFYYPSPDPYIDKLFWVWDLVSTCGNKVFNLPYLLFFKFFFITEREKYLLISKKLDSHWGGDKGWGCTKRIKLSLTLSRVHTQRNEFYQVIFLSYFMTWQAMCC